jgi:ATP-binding cassette subfamily C protein
MIAHRPKSIGQCNKLLMLDNGRMRAFGPRDEVLAEVAPANVRQRASQQGGKIVSLPKGGNDGG